jgi:hypothetical protein
MRRACSSERPSLNIWMERSRLSVMISRFTRKPSFLMRMFWAASTVGVRRRDFFASRTLHRCQGAEVGIAYRRQGCEATAAGWTGKMMALPNSLRLDGFTPADIPAVDDPRVVMTKAGEAYSTPAGEPGWRTSGEVGDA